METAIYDGSFDAAKQYSQIEDVLAGNQFNAFIVVPNDTVGIAGAVEQVGARQAKPLVTALFPIGPDLTNLEPQVKGVTATVANPPAIGAKAQAEKVVEFCKDKNPCNVVILIGQKIYPFDNLRYETYLETLGARTNIKVVATGEGNYDPDKSLTVMQDILQANKDINVVLSNADQHLVGAEIALQNAGYDVPDLYHLRRRRCIDRHRGDPRRPLGRHARLLSRHYGLEGALEAAVMALKGEKVPTADQHG